MTQPGAPPPYSPYPPTGPPPKPSLGRAGCLAGAIAASPFVLVALVCIVLGVMALTEPPRPRPVRQPTTTVRVDHTGTTDPSDPTAEEDEDTRSPTTRGSTTPITNPRTTR